MIAPDIIKQVFLHQVAMSYDIWGMRCQGSPLISDIDSSSVAFAPYPLFSCLCPHAPLPSLAAGIHVRARWKMRSMALATSRRDHYHMVSHPPTVSAQHSRSEKRGCSPLGTMMTTSSTMMPTMMHILIFMSFHHICFRTRLAPRRNPLA